jgi:branched-chain amino acid transport system ATP-binding protein
VLKIENIDVYYGAIHALKSVSLSVEAGEIVAVIGANGAGKSTTLKTISGLLRPRKGSITYEGKRIDNISPDRIVQLGISQVPEGRRIFANLSVMENLDMGAYARKDKTKIADDLQRVFTLFPRLKERRAQRGGTLSGGEQQMLSIARALMARPRLLLMDEPSLGLAPILVEQIFKTIRQINAEGTTILLVEQNASMALQVSGRGYVMETGRVTMCDKACLLAQNEEVKRAYLGGD